MVSAVVKSSELAVPANCEYGPFGAKQHGMVKPMKRTERGRARFPKQSRLSEAVESFAAAARLAQGCRSYRAVLASLETALGRQTKRQELTVQTAGQSARN
jgi:hypothetical protein